MTHAELVAAAVRWLRGTKRCSVVFSEWAPLTVSEIPDALGFDRSGHSILVECKVSRSDFRADRHKVSSRYAARDAGRMGVRRWYLTPPGLVEPSEVPSGWGLAFVHAGRIRPSRAQVRVVVEPKISVSRNVRAELSMLAAAVWRHENGVTWHPDSARFEPVTR